MGDRGIAVLKFSEEYGADLAVCSHWTGSSLRELVTGVAASANFRARLGDESYAARIMVDQLTQDARDQETGYGVYPVIKGRAANLYSDGDVEVTVDLVTGEVT